MVRLITHIHKYIFIYLILFIEEWTSLTPDFRQKKIIFLLLKTWWKRRSYDERTDSLFKEDNYAVYKYTLWLKNKFEFVYFYEPENEFLLLLLYHDYYFKDEFVLLWKTKTRLRKSCYFLNDLFYIFVSYCFRQKTLSFFFFFSRMTTISLLASEYFFLVCWDRVNQSFAPIWFYFISF